MKDGIVNRGFWIVAGGLFGLVIVVSSVSVHPLIGIGLAGGFIVALVIALRPEIGLYLTVIAIPLEKFGRFTEAGSVNVVSIAKIAGLLTLASWFVHVLIYKRRIYFPPEFLLLCVFWVIAALTLLDTTDIHNGLSRASSFLATFIFYLLTVNLIRNEDVLKKTIFFFLLSTLGIGIFSIIQRYLPQFAILVVDDTAWDAAGVVVDLSEEDTLGYAVRRSGGATGSPHVYAANLLVALPLYLCFFRLYSSSAKLLMALGGLVALANLFLTHTRAAILVFILAMFYLTYKKIFTINIKVIITVILLLMVAIPFLPETVIDRLVNIQSYTVKGSATLQARLDYWSSGFEMLKDNWLFGMGIGNFNELAKYNEVATPGFGLLHNIYLQMFNEVGIFGFGTLLIFFIMTWKAYRSAERNYLAGGDKSTMMIPVALSVSFVSVLIMGFTMDFLHFAVKDWWLIAALAVVMRKLSEASRTVQTGAKLESDTIARYV